MTTPKPSGSMFHKGELARLFAMVGMLLVIGMLIFESRNAAMWKFLEEPPEAHNDEGRNRAPPANAAPAGAKADATKADGKKSDAAKDESPNIIPGTDLDPDEWKDVVQYFDPIQDVTSDVTGIEMKAYSRVLHWVELQSVEGLKARTKGQKPPSFRDLTSKASADHFRGKLYKVDLHVLQILEVPVPKDGPLGDKKIYELIGVNQKLSGTKFWYGITDEVPVGIKTGSDLHYDVTYYGYFFKIQGYQERDTPPNKLSKAPLLLGRMEFRPPVAAPPPADHTVDWIIAGAIVGILGLSAGLFYVLVGRKGEAMRPGLPAREASDEGFKSFLEQNGEGEFPPPPPNEFRF